MRPEASHNFGYMLIDGNPSTVVDNRNGPVDMDRDVDLIAESGQRLVDRVIDDFVDQVVQSERSGRSDVHRRALLDSFEAFEDLDLVRRVVGGGRGTAKPRSVRNGRVGRIRLVRPRVLCDVGIFQAQSLDFLDPNGGSQPAQTRMGMMT